MTHRAPASTCVRPTACLLHRIGANDHAAFEEFLLQYRSLLTFLIRRIGRTSARDPEFDDAMQDVCVAVWQAASRFDPLRGSEATFISTVVRRRLIDRFRRGAQPASLVNFSLDTMQAKPSDEQSTLPGAAESALAALDHDARVLVEMRVVHGKNSMEIAEATGLSPGQVKLRIHRTLARLRTQMSTAHAEAA